MPPAGFSWVVPGRLAGMGLPYSPADFAWLRAQGVELLISLTEDSPPRRYINDAGLLHLHSPIPDMEPPTPEQFRAILDAMAKAHAAGMGVAVHCLAGKGRTGTILAGYFVERGLTPQQALAKVRGLRPGSVETEEQEQAVAEIQKRL
jgi:atypical dual specificity phosphatase